MTCTDVVLSAGKAPWGHRGWRLLGSIGWHLGLVTQEPQMGSLPLGYPFLCVIFGVCLTLGLAQLTRQPVYALRSQPWSLSVLGCVVSVRALRALEPGHCWNTAAIWGSFPSRVRCNHLTISFSWNMPINTAGLNAGEAERSGKLKDNVGTRTERESSGLE